MKTKAFHILLPTDFSDNAWNAIVYALKLYVDEFCTFYFLHSTYITNPVSRTYITSHYIDKLKEQALKELAELKAQTEIANANANHDFKTLLFEEELMDAVHEAVKQNAIDIVVMGTKGATGSIDYLFGSNTVKVVKKIKNCPILIVPDEHDFVAPKQIAFPTDYNRFYNDELRPLKSMADLFNSKIRVVHINTEKELSDIQKYNMTMLENYLADYECSFHWLPDYTKKAEAITTFIEELNIEMLAMVKYRHSLLETIINEPVIKKLAFHPKVPVLVIPE
ncbi:universal stress protein UspE [Mariniflexile rhizosphaerae]|uniref:universal stress protein n=1 Tax=unclassified Mariniflexile TaxID=2643887 RepID=UPI000CB97D4B|nr:universal stress protein [Mariniflexile sp. TRM1-10]AXP82277.1 universal stress protein UspE [Mariniflexile sp. TRM1-10]PLB20374.1 MAG: Universal stress protein [Flavobacteriaceae bacterium FS1-H7996/R]